MHKKREERYLIPIDFISFLFVKWEISLKRQRPAKSAKIHYKRRTIMKKKILSLLLGSLLIFPILYVYPIQKQDVEKEILSRFSLNHTVYEGGSGFSMKIIDKTESTDALSRLCDSFLTENFLFVDYMLKDLMVTYLKTRNQNIKEPDEITARYTLFINENKEQLDPVISMFVSYIRWKGQEVTGIEASSKQEITLSELKALAVRNILPLKFTDKGQIMYKICVAGEGFIDYSARNSVLEAFTFDTVMNALKNESLKPITDKPIQVVKKLNLSSDMDTAIKRAQGVFWALIFKDPEFQKLLMDEYQNKKAYLPFIIIKDAEE